MPFFEKMTKHSPEFKVQHSEFTLLTSACFYLLSAQEQKAPLSYTVCLFHYKNSALANKAYLL